MSKLAAITVALALTGALGIAAPQALAAQKYAVLSLVGDSMTVVTYRPSVGSRLDKNDRAAIALNDPVYDRAAAKAVEDALKGMDGQNSVVVLAASSGGNLFKDQHFLFDGRRVHLGDEFSANLRRSGATHLVLITKHRADAKVPLKYGSMGSGTVEGLGFYIDRQAVVDRQEDAELANGFLGPFVYIKVSLVDLANGNVVRDRTITVSQGVTVPRNASNDPWTALSPDEKARMLRGLMTAELGRVVPALVTDAKN
jgi:hypothetical protein